MINDTAYITEDECARNKPKNDSMVSGRHKVPFNLHKETKSVLALFRCKANLKKRLSHVRR